MGTTLRKLYCGLHQMHVFALKGSTSCHPPPVADPVAMGSPIRATHPPPGPILTRILVKYVDFGLAEIPDPGSALPPGGENKILSRKQNVSQDHKILPKIIKYSRGSKYSRDTKY